MTTWRQVGDDRYSCVAPPGYERDPAVADAIHEFDPGVIPFWRLQLWEKDGVEQLVVHHGIARYYPNPRQLRRHIPFAMPAAPEHDAPNFLDAVFEDQTTVQYFRGGPGGYVPWDWRIYYWCRRAFERITVEAFNRKVRSRQAREERIRKQWADEIEYRKKQIEPYLLRQAERLSESDWEQLRARQQRADIRRKLGMDPELLRKKPFVHVKAPHLAPPVPWSPRGSDTYGRVAPVQE